MSDREGSQVTVYLKADVVGPFYEFKSKYLDVTATAIINGALRYYLPVVLKHGADGALQPTESKKSDTIQQNYGVMPVEPEWPGSI
jgi:hypothetical protein